MQELWEGTAEPAQRRSYRDICVDGQIGNVYASELREQVLPYYTGHALQTQCGGIDGRGADFAVHMAASVWGAAEALDRSAGILFMDVVSAFASMARELLDVENASDEVIIAYMQRHGFGPDDWYDLLRVLGAGGALGEAGMPPYLRNIVMQLCTHTWFTVQGVADPASTRRGTRAGNPLGDLIFTLSVTKVLRAVRHTLHHEGLMNVLPAHTEPNLFAGPDGLQQRLAAEVSYVDDTLYYTIEPKPKDMIVQLMAITSIAVRTFFLHGLSINLAAGKTEAVVRLQGPGAVRLWRQLAAQGGMIVSGPTGQPVIINVVTSYKHMGVCSAPAPTRMCEAKPRAAVAFTKVKRLRSKVLAARAMDTDVRTSLGESLIESGLFQGVQAWPAQPQAVWRALDAPRLAMWRAIHGMHNVAQDAGNRYTNDHVYLIAARLPAEHVATLMRLRYFVRLYTKGPDVLKALTLAASCSPSSWLAALHSDLRFMVRAVNTKGARIRNGCAHPIAHLPDPAEVPGPWTDYFKAGFLGWRAALRSAARLMLEEWTARLRAGAGARRPWRRRIRRPGTSAPSAIGLSPPWQQHAGMRRESMATGTPSVGMCSVPTACGA